MLCHKHACTHRFYFSVLEDGDYNAFPNLNLYRSDRLARNYEKVIRIVIVHIWKLEK